MRFVEETWIASFRVSHYAGPFAPWDRQRWREQVLTPIRALLAVAEVHVACNPDGDAGSKTDLLGWLALHRPAPRRVSVERMEALRSVPVAIDVASLLPPTVLYVYVKDYYRGAPWHVGRKLFRHAGIDPWRDRYDYICRTEWLMTWPKEGSGWSRPVVERMSNARWNPRASRWRRRTDGGSEEE